MSEFLSANLPYLLSGISVGGQYALIAIGYTMVYGILRLINFAHGDVFMVAGLVMVYATASLPIYVSIVLVVVVTVAIGVIIEKVAYKPLRSAPRMSVMISAIGVSYLLQNCALYFTGGLPQIYPTIPFLSEQVQIGSATTKMVTIITPILTIVLVLLLVLPLFAVFTRHVQKRMLAAQLDNRRAVAAVSGQVPETLHNIRTIRALGLESYRERRYDRCIGESYAAMERTNFYDAIYSPVVLALNAVVAGIVMLLSASGNAMVLTFFGMSVGTSVAIINYISRIFAPIESLGMEIQTIQSAMAGVKRIDAFLAQPERTIPAERRTAARGDVELAHVTFGYGEKPVLSDFSMTVKQGGQVTLVGRTGAGKSTVFKLLLGLYQPQAGTVTIGGVDVARITDRERRTCIGCVEQQFSRVPGTVLEQITLGDPQITAEMAWNAAKLAGIDEAIQALPEGCDTVCSDGMFSQGEWQLLSIARAAAADPAVLLLDEVTANLDAETEARVLEALRRASAGRTVISVSHRIYENLGGRTVKIEPQSM